MGRDEATCLDGIAEPSLRDWTARLAPYRRADDRRAALQLGATLAAFVGFWYAAYRALALSYALTLVCAALAGVCLVRLTVLQHDLGHASLFRSPRVNEVVGTLLGVLTLLPHHHWRRSHNVHHRDFGNLDRRGTDYVTTLTVAEYLALPRWRRLLYRLHHDPWLVLGIGGPWFFLVLQRWPYEARTSWRVERMSVYGTNVAIVAVAMGLSLLIGWRALLLVHLPLVYVSSTIVVWLFLTQHAFDEAWRARESEWSFLDAAFRGSSYYRLPTVIRWITANIGLHHVHHLSPKIPSYNLQRCLDDFPELARVPTLTIRGSLGAPRLALWDESAGRLVGFREANAAARSA